VKITPPKEENSFYYYYLFCVVVIFIIVGTKSVPRKQKPIRLQPGDNMPVLATNSTLLLLSALTLVV